jgi:hypothetical protein
MSTLGFLDNFIFKKIRQKLTKPLSIKGGVA